MARLFGRDEPAHYEQLRTWQGRPREVALDLIARYGPPDEFTPSMMIWRRRGPWKRTIVHRDESPHHFPKPHGDFLEQTVSYRVPSSNLDALAAYDGSVVAERTRGELVARCDKEEMNILALNLAHEVLHGGRDPKEARELYAKNAIALMLNQPSPLSQTLQFPTLPEDVTADPDESVIGETIIQEARDKFGPALRRPRPEPA